MSLVMMMMMIMFLYFLELFFVLGTFWYSMILGLVVLSGVMVVFTYMASMYPNEKFDMMVGVLLMFMLLSMMSSSSKYSLTFESLELWNKMIMLVNMYLISFLLVVMVMVVWLSSWWSGPVRFYWKL